MDREKIKLEAKKELARREFFYFCNAMAPDFYQEDRDYFCLLYTSDAADETYPV